MFNNIFGGENDKKICRKCGSISIRQRDFYDKNNAGNIKTAALFLFYSDTGQLKI
jgi:hypothetical protein